MTKSNIYHIATPNNYLTRCNLKELKIKKGASMTRRDVIKHQSMIGEKLDNKTVTYK